MKEMKIDFKMFRFASEKAAKDVRHELRTIAFNKRRATVSDFLISYGKTTMYKEHYESLIKLDATFYEFGWTYEQLATHASVVYANDAFKEEEYYYIILPTPTHFKPVVDKDEKENEEEPIDLERIACNVYTDWYDLEDLPEMVDDMMNEIEKELVHRVYIRTKNGEDAALDYNTIPEKLKAMEKDIVYTAYKTILADSEED